MDIGLGCCFDPSAYEIRIWADGCYDGGHFGHANSFRQAKALGTKLIVGVHSDAEIYQHKGCHPLFSETERYAMVGAIKWVDQVVEAAPYISTLETLDKYGCDYCAHGNDITTTSDGTDAYQLVKDAGRYKEVERTLGISTTDIIDRILERGSNTNHDGNGTVIDYNDNISPWTGSSPYLLTTSKIQSFVSNRNISEASQIVYVSGAFDMFHPGHINFLKAAANLGDYLLVGVFDDQTVKAYKGTTYPIMTLNERIMSVLACKYVDNVLIAPPYGVSRDLIDEFRIAIVADGKVTALPDPFTGDNPYRLPKSLGILQVVDSGSSLETENLVGRVIARRVEFEERNTKKKAKEKRIAEMFELEPNISRNMPLEPDDR